MNNINDIIEKLEKRRKQLQDCLPKLNDGSVVSEYEYEEMLGRIRELKIVIELIKGEHE